MSPQKGDTSPWKVRRVLFEMQGHQESLEERIYSVTQKRGGHLTGGWFMCHWDSIGGNLGSLADPGTGIRGSCVSGPSSTPLLAPWDPRGHHSDDKNESEMLTIVSIWNDICFKELSSYSLGIQIKKAEVLGLHLKGVAHFIHVEMNCQLGISSERHL